MRRTHFYLTLLVLLLGAASVCAQSAPPPPPPPPSPDYFPEKWSEYVYEKDGVKFRFPVKPEVIAQKDASGGITTHAYRRRSFIDLFLAVNEFPAGARIEAVVPEQYLNGMRDDIVARLKDSSPKIIREADTAVDGHPAKFMHIETGDGRVVRLKFFVVKNRIYLMSAEVRKGQRHGFNYENDFEKVAMAFLDSVRPVPPAR